MRLGCKERRDTMHDISLTETITARFDTARKYGRRMRDQGCDRFMFLRNVPESLQNTQEGVLMQWSFRLPSASNREGYSFGR